MLSANVQSVAELMSIALCAEREAVRRYSGLAQTMRANGNADAAALFERMVAEEREHERLIEEWAKTEGLALNAEVGPIVWEDPHVGTRYDTEARDPARSTPYRALAFAVHNEERAFRFYTHVAANTADKRVREYAETLAREELGHAALLRAMRRRAWRTEKESDRDTPDIDPGNIHSRADLLTVAAGMERCMADQLSTLSGRVAELDEAAATTRRSLEELRAQLETAGDAGDDAAQAAALIARYTSKIAAADSDVAQSLRRLRADSDRCFEFYDAVVTRTKDEAVMLAAQWLSQAALARIDTLHRILGNEDRSTLASAGGSG